MLIDTRYFTRGYKLDYPNAETTKASKKYVKAMKHLHVSSTGYEFSPSLIFFRK